LGSYTDSNLDGIRNVGVSGSHVVLSDGRTVQLLDVSNPANPSLVGTYNPPAFAFSLAVNSTAAYLACGNAGLVIVNLVPGAVSLLGTFSPSSLVTSVSVSGNTAYLASPGSGWWVVDVSNPAPPALVRAYTSQGPILNVAAAGTNLVLGTSANTLAGMNASAPLTPVQTASFGPVVNALRLAASPTLAVSVEDEAGLAIFSASDDLNQDGIPDWWEMQIVNASAATNGPIHTIWDVRPTDDFDGDGASNYAEYLAGTSPVDPASVFMMSAQAPAGGGTMNIQWTSAAGKIYTLYKSTDLKAGFSVFKDNIAATPPVNSEGDATTSGSAFYIVRVK
jgi:hypothetical protein